MTRSESLRTLGASLHSRINEISLLIQSGDVKSAQADYDLARWAVDDLHANVTGYADLCGTSAPRPTQRLQTLASQLRTSWSATRGACVSEYARRGIDCD